jgi:hypothetical protein
VCEAIVSQSSAGYIREGLWEKLQVLNPFPDCVCAAYGDEDIVRVLVVCGYDPYRLPAFVDRSLWMDIRGEVAGVEGLQDGVGFSWDDWLSGGVQDRLAVEIVVFACGVPPVVCNELNEEACVDCGLHINGAASQGGDEFGEVSVWGEGSSSKLRMKEFDIVEVRKAID